MCLIKYILCFVILSCANGLPSVSKFRSDYAYSSNTNHYYKLHAEKTSWQDAVAICKSEGSQLYYPVDEVEAKEVDVFTPWTTRSRNYIWIGISDLRKNEFYETIDGRPLSEIHNRWDKNWGEPDRSNNHHCVIMWSAHELWLEDCSKQVSFICKYSPESGDENTYSHESGDNTTPNQFETTTETSTLPIETTATPLPTTTTTPTSTITPTTPVIEETTPSGLEIPGLPTEVVDDQPSHVHFGNLVGQELKRFRPKEKLQIMVSILEIIQSYDVQEPTQWLDHNN